MSYAQPIIDAFLKGKNKKIKNTESYNGKLLLFNNCIAKWDKEELWITLANHNSRTTRQRLSLFPDIYVRSIKNDIFLFVNNNKIKWDGSWINISKLN